MLDVSFTFDTTALLRYGQRAQKLQPVMGGKVLGVLQAGVREQVSRWPSSHAFGSRSPSNLAGLRADWLDDHKVTDTSVSMGVNRKRHWYVSIFQHAGPMRLGAARRGEKRVKAGRNKGRLSKQIALGIKYGLWISADRLRRGFTLQPRRVVVTNEMAQVATRHILDYIVGGDEATP